MLEKIAPTLIAGVPAIVKPASQTAYLTELVVRRIVESGILPDGALQLIAGSIGDLLDHVTGQDVVTFTGSAWTGRKLQTHPAIVENSTRFTMEADSLNAAILGPDAGPGTPEFDLFVQEVAREMTVKAGQKCTAIRRVIAPRAFTDAARRRPRRPPRQDRPRRPVERGHPHGPPRQPRPAQGGPRAHPRARRRKPRSSPATPTPCTVASGDAEKGAFLNPVVLYCRQPARQATAIHDVEAFGPVSTVMPYDDLDEAIALAKRGKGSLVASVFTDDKAVAEEAVLGLAPFHGRVLIGNRLSAKTSTGHGSPLPVLVHGGPGRAGGGEEMGGIRGVKHYMQRTAVQGAPAPPLRRHRPLDRGRRRPDDGTHPFRKSLAELKIGDQLVTATREVTLADIEHFAAFTGDTFYAHMDEAAAKANPFFDGRVAHGYLIVSFAAGLFVDPAPGPVLANYGVDNLRFLTPVYPGDTLGVRLTCKEINPRDNADHGEVRWDCQVTKQDGALVAQYDVLTMVAKTWPPRSVTAGSPALRLVAGRRRIACPPSSSRRKPAAHSDVCGCACAAPSSGVQRWASASSPHLAFEVAGQLLARSDRMSSALVSARVKQPDPPPIAALRHRPRAEGAQSDRSASHTSRRDSDWPRMSLLAQLPWHRAQDRLLVVLRVKSFGRSSDRQPREGLGDAEPDVIRSCSSDDWIRRGTPRAPRRELTEMRSCPPAR